MTRYIKYPILMLLTLFFMFSCGGEKEQVLSQEVLWENRIADLSTAGALNSGSTYLSTYAEIYRYSEKEYKALTATISMRNINKNEPVYIDSIEYYNTDGVLLNSYISQSIYIAPMETIEIVIAQADTLGGTGANFVFDWQVKAGINDPFFEAVMVSSEGNQGLAFVTQGIRIE